MESPGASAQMLDRAFQRFTGAASALEERQAALALRVDALGRELIDSHRRLEAVLDAVDGGVAVVSSAGELLRTNRAFDRLRLGARGGPLHPALARAIGRGRRRPRSTALRLELPQGPRDLCVAAVPTGDQNATLVLTVKDVTAIRLEEQEGGRRRRLEALGRLAAELAHEVRNPLGGVRLFASMLRDDLADRPEQREMAVQILGAVEGLEAAVSGLLELASPPAGHTRELDLAALAREVVALVAPSCAARGVRLAGPTAADRCPLRGDAEGLRRVLLNLVSNALAATGAGGTIEVAARRRAGGVRLSVADTGRGIEPDDLPRVFDPFFSRREGGTGLGLAIVHRIVERHGGRIAIDSRPGAGTTVRVELPPRPVPRDGQEDPHV